MSSVLPLFRFEPPDVHYMRAFEQALTAVGVTREQRDAALRTAHAKPRRFDARPIDMFAQQAFSRALVEHVGDRFLGLRLGLAMPIGANGVVEYAMLTAATLRETQAVHARLSALTSEYVTYSLVDQGGGYTAICFAAPAILKLDESFEDFRMARLMSCVRRVLKQGDFAPSAVHFTYARPAQLALYEQTFGKGVSCVFGQRAPALHVPTSIVDRALPSSDPTLHRILVDHAEALLNRPSVPAKLSTRVRELLMSSLHEGRPSLAAVAKQLSMSERTLRRHLADEGTSFGELLDQVRASLSEALVSCRERSGKSLASKLGFESTSALRRAQKRWSVGTSAAGSFATPLPGQTL